MVIKDKTIANDDWTVHRLGEKDAPESVAVPPGKVIVPLKVWQAQRAALRDRAELGVWLASDERAEELANDIERFSVIAVDFPKFADGRGYSIARLLRERYGYKGELRAVGEVARVNLHAMAQCSFDAFELRAGEDPQEALKAFGDFSEAYQASAAQPIPLFRRRGER